MANYISECNSGKLRVDPKTFRQTWCVRCSRPDCEFAEFAREDPMAYRQATWRERYFGDNQADMAVPRFARIAAIDFPDLLRKAVRLEISERRGDWSVPEIKDDRRVKASPLTTEQVDEEDRWLGYKQEETFRADSEGLPFGVEDHRPTESESPYPEENVSPAVTPHPDGGKDPREHSNRKAVVQRPSARNVPDCGEVMLGGSPVPTKRLAPVEERDPWAAPPKPKYTVVKTGASIQFGSSGTIQVLDD